MRSTRTHIRANIIGYVALFFALSTGAYAAGLADNSVKSKHIKDGQVTSNDVLDNSLAGSDIVESSLNGVPVSANTVGSGQVADNSLGAPDLGANSVTSSEIANNNVNAAKLGEVITRSANYSVQTNAAYPNGFDASCLPGEELLGGGGGWDQQIQNADWYSSQRVGVSQTWRVHATQFTGSDKLLQVDAICLG